MMQYLNPEVLKPDAFDRWTAIAEQWYKKRYGKDQEVRVWSELMDEAWDKLYENIKEEHMLGDEKPKYKATIGWSGPWFNTMDGGDYDWGSDVFYSDDKTALVHYAVARLLDMKLCGYQSADVTYDDGMSFDMDDLIVPWQSVHTHSPGDPN